MMLGHVVLSKLLISQDQFTKNNIVGVSYCLSCEGWIIGILLFVQDKILQEEHHVTWVPLGSRGNKKVLSEREKNIQTA